MLFNNISLVEILSILFGGGVGALCMQIYTARSQKNQMNADVENTLADVARKRQDNQQDAFDTVYQQLNQCMKDYTDISEEYREHREKMRKYEESVQQTIREKCIELSELKARITYFKGIRCYDTLCPKRLLEPPAGSVIREDTE